MNFHVWHDYSGSRTVRNLKSIVDWYVEMGFSGVRIMLEDQAVTVAAGQVRPLRVWDETIRFSHYQLRTLVSALRGAGLSVTFTVWPHVELVSEEQDKYLEWLGDCIAHYGPDAVELDCESYNFMRHSRRIRGRVLHQFIDTVRSYDFVRHHPCELHITCIVSHLTELMREFGSRVDVWAPQAYSVSRMYDYDHAIGGPAHLPGYAIQEWRGGGSTGRLVMGLAAYGQAWRRHSVTDAMEASLQACADLGVTDVSYWSADNLDSSSRGEHRRVVQSWAQQTKGAA